MLAWYGGVASAELFISALTIGEIRLGIERLRRKDPAQAELLEQWLRGLQVTYADHIVDVDTATAGQWGRLNVPESLPVLDGLIAASARARGWTMVTRNTAEPRPRRRPGHQPVRSAIGLVIAPALADSCRDAPG